MTDRKPPADAAELFRRANRLSADADWTDEELREELRAGGVDPELLIAGARARLAQLRRDAAAEPARGETAQAADAHASVLAELRSRTGLPASQVAARMGVTVPFLSAVGRHPRVVPAGWRRELDARAVRGLGVEAGAVMRSFERPYQAQMAASRDEPYAAEQMTPEGLLEQSGMGDEQRREWSRLASEE